MGSIGLTSPEDSDYGSFDDEDFLEAEAKSRKRSIANEDHSQLSKKPRISAAESEIAEIQIARSILKNIWGFPCFRLQQEAAISRLVRGDNAAVIFPTGGGKSLIYQIPALAFDAYDSKCGRPPGRGVTLIVSPLIALMKDQVDALRRRGVKAAAMDSSQTRDQWLDTTELLRKDELKLLYVAPERLNNEGFVEMIKETKIRMVAVDEAHCISEWGHAFRPDYLKIARFVKEIEAERVLCLTATAAPEVVKDICKNFDISDSGVFRTTTYRPNLRLLAQSFTTREEKLPALEQFLRSNQGSSIVYVQTHEQTEQVSAFLRKSDLDARSYHAGMQTEARTLLQDAFMPSKNMIIVATIAFGMGIDKADIRNIVHFALPKSLEGYSQEIGRAGRDCIESTCVTYLCAEDMQIMEEWSRADVPSKRSIRGLVGELIEMHRYSKVGDIIERNLNDESREWDIRLHSLGLLNAQLELRFNLIRAITPRYSTYKYKQSPDFHAKTQGNNSNSNTAKVIRAIKSSSKPSKVWTHLDVDATAATASVDRSQIVSTLQSWHNAGAIELSPSGVISRFRILSPFPTTEADKKSIIDKIYTQIEAKETESIARISDVVELLTAPKCFSRSLAAHFGDSDSVPADGCGHCQVCITQTALPFVTANNTTSGHKEGKSCSSSNSKRDKIDKSQIAKILAATTVRDDARFLARVAFGISSPRVTSEKLAKHEVFGSMSRCDFRELEKVFAEVCDEE